MLHFNMHEVHEQLVNYISAGLNGLGSHCKWNVSANMPVLINYFGVTGTMLVQYERTPFSEEMLNSFDIIMADVAACIGLNNQQKGLGNRVCL